MLAVMESTSESSTDPVSEFLVTGRTGRRNAMADILGPHAAVTSGDLPERLQSLTTTDSEAGPSSSSTETGQREIQDAGCSCSGTSSPGDSAPPAAAAAAKPKSEQEKS